MKRIAIIALGAAALLFPAPMQAAPKCTSSEVPYKAENKVPGLYKSWVNVMKYKCGSQIVAYQTQTWICTSPNDCFNFDQYMCTDGTVITGCEEKAGSGRCTYEKVEKKVGFPEKCGYRD